MNYAIKINGKKHYKNITKRLEKLGVKSDEDWNVDKKHFVYDRDCHLKVEDKLYSIFTHDCCPTKLVTIEELESIMNKAKKPIFKKGDRVFTITYGWKSINEFVGNINGFNCYILDGIDGGVVFHENTLSFTEYTLQGISQDRQINWNDYIGEWGFFWDDEKYKVFGKLEEYVLPSRYPFRSEGGYLSYNFKPITPELKELLIKENIIK